MDASWLTAAGQVSGWTAFGLLVALNVFGFFKDWIVTRGAYSAMKDLLTTRGNDALASASKWETLYQSEHVIVLKLTDQGEITKKFFSEVAVVPRTGHNGEGVTP
jgi:hypothetical protein